MSGLDRIRAPKGRGWLYWLVVAVVTVMLMIVSMSWWAGAELWKLVVAGGISALVGALVANRFVAHFAGKRR